MLLQRDRREQQKNKASKSVLKIWQFNYSNYINYDDKYYALVELLNFAERARALQNPKFAISRGLLRLILSQYLNLAPAEIRFSGNRYGKPFLAFPHQNLLHFNLSHSDNLGLIAISNNPIGIDIEYCSPRRNFDQLVQKFFTQEEQEEYLDLLNLSVDQKITWFYQKWTAKEALVKAMGKSIFSVNSKVFLDSAANYVTQSLDAQRLNSAEKFYQAAVAIKSNNPLIFPENFELFAMDGVVE